MLTDDEARTIALAGALDLAAATNKELVEGSALVTAAEVVESAKLFHEFLMTKPEAQFVNRPVWRDSSPTITPLRTAAATTYEAGLGAHDLVDHGKSLPGTHGTTPLVSTTVVKNSPESLREMRARADQERKNGVRVDLIPGEYIDPKDFHAANPKPFVPEIEDDGFTTHF